MKISEIYTLDEGGKSDGVRYNSEIAFLYTLAGNSKLNPKNPSASFDLTRFNDPDRVEREINRFLVPNYSEKTFNNWLLLSEKYITAIQQHQGKPITQLGWAGGTNKNDDGVADVVFYNYPVAGVSIKDVGGITLNNLTPKKLGLETSGRGQDLFGSLAEQEFLDMKVKIFRDVLDDARRTPDVEQSYGGTRGITYNSKSQEFFVRGSKNTFRGTEKDIIAQATTRIGNWQRVFGDWFQLNWSSKKEYAAPLYKKISLIIEKRLEETLQSQEALLSIMQFADSPYYYATTKGLYYVPSAADAADLRLKRIYYGNPDGTAQRFMAEIGRPDNKNNAIVTIYIRYANGMFESNPTVRVQSLKNPENMMWEKII